MDTQPGAEPAKMQPEPFDPFPFKPDGLPNHLKAPLPLPPWRQFTEEARKKRGTGFKIRPDGAKVVNAALLLRRPLLVTGRPGTGKTTLAYAVAEQLGLGDVLHWPITTRTTLQQGLYAYDAIGRLQEAARLRSEKRPGGGAGTDEESVSDEPAEAKPKDQPDGGAGAKQEMELTRITRFLRLGPLGTAFFPLDENRKVPRVLVVDEIDKGDIDLPNDLLHVFEEGEFEIPELSRLSESDPDYKETRVQTHGGAGAVTVRRGRVPCDVFPFVVMTSNGERVFPPAFLRRCLCLELDPPERTELEDIVRARLGKDPKDERVQAVITAFLEERNDNKRELATDQLLNAVHLVFHGVAVLQTPEVREALFRDLRNPTKRPTGPKQ